MIIKSTIPLLWPHLGFSLDAGVNDIDESKIPLKAHRKLAHYAKSRVITGYTPSAKFIEQAEQAMRPLNQPATLDTLHAAQAKAGAQ